MHSPAGRRSDESVESYFARKIGPINHAQFIRKVLGKDVSGDWLRPHLDGWALGLGNVSMATATVTLPVTATLRDFFDTVQKVSAVIPTVTSKDTHFNAMRDQSDMEDEEPNVLHAVSTTLNTLANETKATNRDLNSRLMAIESLNHLGYYPSDPYRT